MNLAQQNTSEGSGFKVVCLECGSLSIKVTDLANAPDDTPIECGRCRAVRGTVADLHLLARRGGDVFEF
jgi:hypothetical protein